MYQKIYSSTQNARHHAGQESIETVAPHARTALRSVVMRIAVEYECLHFTARIAHGVGVLHERSGETVSLEHAELLHLFIRNVEELLFLLFRREPDRYVQKSRTPTFATYPNHIYFKFINILAVSAS